jgi:hypothetical protein
MPRLPTIKSIKSVYGFIPVPVISSPWLPGRIVGLSLGFAVLVREDYANDEPTLIHELVHCKQFFRSGGLFHFLLYFGSTAYRLKTELEAYRAEISSCAADIVNSRLNESAAALAYGYRLKLSTEECKALLLLSPSK